MREKERIIADNGIWSADIGKQSRFLRYFQPFYAYSNRLSAFHYPTCPAALQCLRNYCSLIETAKHNGLNPNEYLAKVFEIAPLIQNQEEWNELLPWNIK